MFAQPNNNAAKLRFLFQTAKCFGKLLQRYNDIIQSRLLAYRHQ